VNEREDLSQLATLREALADREVRIAELHARLTDREREIAQLRETRERAEATNLEAKRELRLRLAQALGTPASARSARQEPSMAALRQLGGSVLRDSRVVALKRAFESVPALRKQRLRALGARIESSGLFDRDYYLKSNPDVRDTGIDPARHYLVQGWKELRDPSPGFSTAKYLLDHRDIAARGINPLAHYLEHGHSEGRLIFPSSATRRARSALSAIAALPGESALGRPDAAIAEEVRVIREAGRFDGPFYRAPYVDIEPPTADPVRHYCETGWREGRNPSNDFDTRFYLETYSDVRDSGMNPFYHYVLAGAAEQRRARPDFATRYEDDIWFGDAASEVKLLAFHVVPDWPVLRNARAGLKGFTQPPFPHEEVGFYDPADPAVLARQAAAARCHGIHGFCFDLADSETAEEAVRVLRSVLEHPEISLPFCVQWPLRQDTIDNPPLGLLARALRDPRYVRAGTRPLVVLAAANDDGNAQADVASLHERLPATAGGEPLLVARPATDGETTLAAACDAVLDLPVAADRTEPGDFRPQDRNGVDVVPYGIVAAQGIARSKRSQSAPRATYHAVSLGRCQPGKDGMRPLVHSHFDTRDYRRWLDAAIASARAAHGEDRRFVFLNAWNAWHEGLALEPDRQGGHTRLNETTRALLGIASGAYMPKVSVIVPNYNHEGFLRRRLESIYGQTYKNIEVILLDDASTDASRTVLDRYAAAHPHITRRLYNDRNSGGVFRQWAKGIRAATGDLVWIAESDDYCDAGFLEVLTRFFADEAVLLAYARSAFVDRDGFPIRDDFEQYLADLPDPGRWHEPYVATAHDEVRTGLGIKNTIPNASGVVFRRPPDMPLLDDSAWLGMSVAGDWVFYLHVLRGGKIAYTTATTNYFRRYSGSTAESSYRKEAYFREGGLASRTVASLYDVPLEVLEHCRRNYESAYEALVGGDSDRFWEWYDYASVLRARSRRVPNIMVSTLGFYPGGAEILPIRLANELKRRGHSVLLFSAGLHAREDLVRRMLRNDVPVVETSGVPDMRAAIQAFGIECLNSHQWYVQKYPVELPDVFH
jgi:glycosyltransferase involved in cell wall biosynthesis